MRSLAPSLAAVLALAAMLALAGCSSAPPRVYAPLRYDYLTPIRLNVQSVTVESRFVPGGSGDLNPRDPSPLVPTLTAMAQDRIQAVGSTGRAVFVIKDATLRRGSDGIDGSIAVELDVYADGGTRAGFAEARVSRHRGGDPDDMASTLYDMTKQLMDAINIEFEYQVRHSLHDWLVPTNVAPQPVQQQALPPPPGSAAAPPPPAPSGSAPPLAAPIAPPMAPPVPYPTPAPGQTLKLPTPLVPPRQP